MCLTIIFEILIQISLEKTIRMKNRFYAELKRSISIFNVNDDDFNNKMYVNHLRQLHAKKINLFSRILIQLDQKISKSRKSFFSAFQNFQMYLNHRP